MSSWYQSRSGSTTPWVLRGIVQRRNTMDRIEIDSEELAERKASERIIDSIVEARAATDELRDYVACNGDGGDTAVKTVMRLSEEHYKAMDGIEGLVDVGATCVVPGSEPAESMRSATNHAREQATIIGADMGSGKTLASLLDAYVETTEGVCAAAESAAATAAI